MIDWFDLMRQAQSGAGIENVARRFGLSPQQMSAAIAALMPAFAMGLQRAAMNPAAMARLFQAMSGGHFPSFWESAAQAFTPQAQSEGNRLLDQLFGSDEVSRRVARQAAAFSGIGVDILQQMLPLLAGIMAGGLTKIVMTPGSLFPNLTTTAQATQPEGALTDAGAWVDLWSQWMGIARPPEPQAGRQAPSYPFEEMMTSFLRAGFPQGGKAEEPEPAPDKPEPASGPFETWGEMVEKGQEMQRQYLASLQSILDGAWGRRQDRF